MYTCVVTPKTFSRLFVQPGTGNPAEPDLRRYYSVVPIADIPDEWSEWLEVNARDSSNKGKVPAAIRETLSEKPEWFAAYNRGLTLVVSSVQWDNQTKRLTLGFDDRRYHGVLDGGHTPSGQSLTSAWMGKSRKVSATLRYSLASTRMKSRGS